MRATNRGQHGLLARVGSLPPGAMLAFGIAMVLLLASIGLIAVTLNARRSAPRAVAVASPSPTASAIAAFAATETLTPSPVATATSTPRPLTATPTRRATPATPRVAATPAPLGAGQTTAIRGLAGSMLASTGGGLALPAASPTAPAAGGLPPGTMPPYNPPPMATNAPRATNPPVYNPPSSNPPVYNPPVYNPPSNPPYSPPPNSMPTYPPAVNIPGGMPTAAPGTTPITPAPGGGSATPPASAGSATLPAVAFPIPAPGEPRYNLTYTLNADLTTAPKSAYAYQVTWRLLTRAEFEQLATALGVPGPVQATSDGFIATGNGRLALSNGLLTYMSPLAVGKGNATPAAPAVTPSTAPATAVATSNPAPSATGTVVGSPTTTPGAPTATPTTGAAPPSAPPTSSPAPTGTPVSPAADDAARATAKAWLTTHGLFPANADTGEVWRPAPDQTVVIFHPLEPRGAALGDPQVLVVIDPAGAIRMAQYRWPASTTPTLSRLRTPQQAWADLQAGKGYAQVNWTVPADTAPGTTFTGAANVTKVSIGWTSAVNAAGQTYLIPLYVFEGTTTIAGTGMTVPFRAFAVATAP